MGGALKKLADERPGTCIWFNHHTRKEAATDVVDTASGTNGIAGSADTIGVLVRERGEQAGTLSVVGRDLDEDVTIRLLSHNWRLDGATLGDAANAHERAISQGKLGDRSNAVLEYLGVHGEITTEIAANVLLTTSSDASRVLDRHRAAGRIIKTGRGKWALVPTGVFGMSGALGGLESPKAPDTPGDTRARGIDWQSAWATADKM
jgi:hypothetical protein